MIAALLKMGVAKNKTEEPKMRELLAAKIEKAGVPADELNEVVKLVAAAENAVFIYGKRTSTEGLKSIAELAELLRRFPGGRQRRSQQPGRRSTRPRKDLQAEWTSGSLFWRLAMMNPASSCSRNSKVFLS